jgi:hypothetical protein
MVGNNCSNISLVLLLSTSSKLAVNRKCGFQICSKTILPGVLISTNTDSLG